MRQRLLRFLAIAVGLGTVSISQAEPGQEKAGALSGDNPALKRFNQAITFYLSFDGDTTMEMGGGKPAPTKFDGEPQFHPGLYGQAMMLMGKSESHLQYSTLDNVDLTRPGSVVAWTCPKDWVRSENEDYFFPVVIMCNGAKLMFGRQGRLKEGRVDMVYAAAKLGDTKDILIGGGGSLKWKNGEWHLWVMNWRSSSVEFSMDGGALNRQDTPVRFNSDGDGAGHFIVGSQTASNRYLLDEVMALNRPLTEEEVKWIYDEGMKQSQRAPKESKP